MVAGDVDGGCFRCPKRLCATTICVTICVNGAGQPCSSDYVARVTTRYGLLWCLIDLIYNNDAGWAGFGYAGVALVGGAW